LTPRERLTVHQQNYQRLLRQAEGSQLEAVFDLQARAHGIEGLVPDYRFHPDRKWELDRALPSLKLGVEIQGGIHGRPVTCNHCHRIVQRTLANGRIIPVRQGMGHSTGTGIQRDIDKLNAAQELGWQVVLLSADMIENGAGIALLQRFIHLRSRTSPLS
jgi:hypothetical protein